MLARLIWKEIETFTGLLRFFNKTLMFTGFGILPD